MQNRKHKHNSIMQPSRRTFKNRAGKWIEKRAKTIIVLCPCGNKYIQTIKNQTLCVLCMYRKIPARAV